MLDFSAILIRGWFLSDWIAKRYHTSQFNSWLISVNVLFSKCDRRMRVAPTSLMRVVTGN
jgi:hypothetical protein